MFWWVTTKFEAPLWSAAVPPNQKGWPFMTMDHWWGSVRFDLSLCREISLHPGLLSGPWVHFCSETPLWSAAGPPNQTGWPFMLIVDVFHIPHSTMEKKPAVPPPSNVKPPLDDCICPSCKRSFKSARGVSQHRRIANCYADLDTPALETIIKEKIRTRPDVKLEVCIDIAIS